MKDNAIFPASFVMDRNITAAQFRVYGAIRLHEKNGEARPSLQTLSETTGIDSSRVCVTLRKLESGGWIQRKKEGQRNVYVLR